MTPMQRTLQPMLANEEQRPPVGEEWAFEIKWDGVRALAHSDGEGGLLIQSRRGTTAPQASRLVWSLCHSTERGHIVGRDDFTRKHRKRLCQT